MALLDWLRGRNVGDRAPGGEDQQAERMEARRTEQEPTSAATEPTTTDTAQERRDEEAARHSGI